MCIAHGRSKRQESMSRPDHKRDRQTTPSRASGISRCCHQEHRDWIKQNNVTSCQVTSRRITISTRDLGDLGSVELDYLSTKARHSFGSLHRLHKHLLRLEVRPQSVADHMIVAVAAGIVVAADHAAEVRLDDSSLAFGPLVAPG